MPTYAEPSLVEQSDKLEMAMIDGHRQSLTSLVASYMMIFALLVCLCFFSPGEEMYIVFLPFLPFLDDLPEVEPISRLEIIS